MVVLTFKGAASLLGTSNRGPTLKMASGAVGEWQPTTEPGQAAGFAVKVHG